MVENTTKNGENALIHAILYPTPTPTRSPNPALILVFLKKTLISA